MMIVCTMEGKDNGGYINTPIVHCLPKSYLSMIYSAINKKTIIDWRGFVTVVIVLLYCPIQMEIKYFLFKLLIFFPKG